MPLPQAGGPADAPLAGLAGRYPKRFRRTTISDPLITIPDLVQRDFTPTGPNHLWVGDITYIRTWESWLYLAVLLDCYSRRVVGWSMADHLRTELPLEALRMALARRSPAPELIHHTDRGCQGGFKGWSHLRGLHQPSGCAPHPFQPQPATQLLGQRCRRELLRHPEVRPGLPLPVAYPSYG